MQAFSPFRVVGSVCGERPASLTMMYDAPILMVPIGRTFQLFRGHELTMLRGGPVFEKNVRCVAQTGKFRFVAEGSRVHCFSQHKSLWTKEHCFVSKAKVNVLLARDELLLSVGEDKCIVVWNAKAGEQLQKIPVPESETVSSMIIAEGYTNKILIATLEGSIHLINFHTKKLVFSSKRSDSKDTALGGQILCMTPSHHRDIIAYGTSTGGVYVYNYGTDTVLVSLRHDGGAAVTAMIMREDREGYLVTGTSLGEVAVWDLAEQCLDGILTRSKQVKSKDEALDTPHVDAVHTLVFIPKTHLLVTGAGDNALMQFRFDTVDGCGLLVRERRGHMGTCTVARFFNTDLVVTAGSDQALRVTHVFSDRASWELSQGKLGRRGRDMHLGREALKLPPATTLVSSTLRNYQWASVVSLHEASAVLCGWRMDNRCIESKLSGISSNAHTARCVALSECGNFAVVGYSSGHLTRINLQNKGLHQFFQSQDCQVAHTGGVPVETVQIMASNRLVISASSNGVFHLWTLLDLRFLSTIATGRPTSHSCLHRLSSLLCVVHHFSIAVYQLDAYFGTASGSGGIQEDSKLPFCRKVRDFEGHQSPITALAIVPDSLRYVVSASSDAGLYLWDLSAGVCVGQVRMPSPVSSLSFHPDALFLVTTHMGEKGAYLWTNNLRYGFVPDVVSNLTNLSAAPLLHFPVAHVEHEESDAPIRVTSPAEMGVRPPDVEHADVPLFDSTTDLAMQRSQKDAQRAKLLDEILCPGLRLSGLPSNVWSTLPLLDQIKQKNQPILPPKKRDVPFFLPTTSELRPTFLVPVKEAENGLGTAGAAAARPSLHGANSPFEAALAADDFEGAMGILKVLNASEMDLELKRCVDFVEDTPYSAPELEHIRASASQLLRFLTFWVLRRENADLVQGMLADVVKAHGRVFSRLGEKIIAEMDSLAAAQDTLRQELEHLYALPNAIVGVSTGAF